MGFCYMLYYIWLDFDEKVGNQGLMRFTQLV